MVSDPPSISMNVFSTCLDCQPSIDGIFNSIRLSVTFLLVDELEIYSVLRLGAKTADIATQ